MGALPGNGIVPLSFSKESHAAFQGVGITIVDKGVQDYLDGQIYTTDARNGPVEPYTGEAVALEGDGIPTA